MCQGLITQPFDQLNYLEVVLNHIPTLSLLCHQDFCSHCLVCQSFSLFFIYAQDRVFELNPKSVARNSKILNITVHFGAREDAATRYRCAFQPDAILQVVCGFQFQVFCLTKLHKILEIGLSYEPCLTQTDNEQI